MKISALILILIFFCFPAKGEEKKETFKLNAEQEKMVFDTVNEISECGGKMYAVSQLLHSLGKENASSHFHELGNGWYMAAAYTAFSLSAISDWKNAITYSEERAKSIKTQILGNFELTPENELESELKKLTDELNICKLKWEEYQIKQIEELRQKMYKEPESETDK